MNAWYDELAGENYDGRKHSPGGGGSFLSTVGIAMGCGGFLILYLTDTFNLMPVHTIKLPQTSCEFPLNWRKIKLAGSFLN